MKPYVTIGDVFDELPRPDSSDEYPNHVAPCVQEKTVTRIAETDPGEELWESYNQNRRLERETIAPTIIGRHWKYAHPLEDRPLTVRERAALQSFPHDFEFHGPRQQKRLQVANAVPVDLAEAVAREIRK